jgi:NADPH-dependent 2,4-dienoyl-CoA reductase/sulfur reductase-like enzyme
MAGVTAAQEIRRADPSGQVTLIGDEGEPYYYRASLSEWISGQTTDEMLPGRTAAFYDDLRIAQVEGHVTHVDPEARLACLAGGETVPYDRLLVATGGRANTFPIRGLKKTLVFRKLQDAREIKERVGCCGRVLILGGGVLGLELAGALFKMGIEDIAVVQRSGYVGGPLLDEPSAGWLQERMRADGITLYLNDTVERVDVQTAYMYCKQTWDFDLFVQAVGITPCFPSIPDLETGKGIRVDNGCRTNLPDIYAAGDCTETRAPGSDRWRPTRIWLDCARQGRTAGRNMAGGEAALCEEPFFNASVLYTALYSYIGEPHGDEGKAYVWQGERGYRKVRVVDGRLAGALLLKERHGSMALFKAIGQPVPEGVGKDIARPDFPYNDLSGQDWDYCFY